MSYTHFTLEERKYLQQLLSEGYSFRKIAIILERSPSSVSREVRRNKAKWRPHQKPDNPYWYNHWRAQNLYIRRRRESIRMALLPDSEEWNYIVSHLEQYWSPEAICGRWHKDYPSKKTLCVSTIYRYIYLKRFPSITAKTHLRRHGNGFCPEIPITTPFSPIGLSLSGRRRFVVEPELVIGKATQFTEVSAKVCW